MQYEKTQWEFLNRAHHLHVCVMIIKSPPSGVTLYVLSSFPPRSSPRPLPLLPPLRAARSHHKTWFYCLVMVITRLDFGEVLLETVWQIFFKNFGCLFQGLFWPYLRNDWSN